MYGVDFWVEPCLGLSEAYVVYRKNGREILVNTSGGILPTTKEMLTAAENQWFKKNIQS